MKNKLTLGELTIRLIEAIAPFLAAIKAAER